MPAEFIVVDRQDIMIIHHIDQAGSSLLNEDLQEVEQKVRDIMRV